VEYDDIIYDQIPRTRNSLRIAVVTETYPPEVNGVAMTIGRMVTGLLERGHQIELVRPRQGAADHPANGSNFQEVLQRGIPIPRYDQLRIGMPAKQVLVQRWTRNRPDIVHLVTEGPLGWSALSAAAKLRIPCTSDFHTNFHAYSKHYGFGWLRKPIAAYLRKLHNRMQRTFVPTESLRRELEQMNFRNLQVVARGVDVALFDPAKRSTELRKRWGMQPQHLAVAYVGRLAPEKNLPTVVRAFSAIRGARPDARLVLVGDGPERGALQASLPEAVFPGFRYGDDLAVHYASADIFLFPSVTETFGNVTIEAMASGLAVVAYDYGAAAEHMEHGRTGLLAPFDRTNDFVELAAGLANDPDRIARLSRGAREKAETLDWRSVNDAFESALMNIARSEKPDAAVNTHAVSFR
jgi:glycosyltransferase involved in cell wall biosynthesis